MKISKIFNITFLLAILMFSLQANGQLLINSTPTPTQMVQNVLVGGGVTVNNVTFQGVYSATGASQIAIFTNGNTTNLGMDQGIVIASGDVHSIPATPGTMMSSDLSGAGSAEITNIAGNTSYDAAVLSTLR